MFDHDDDLGVDSSNSNPSDIMLSMIGKEVKQMFLELFILIMKPFLLFCLAATVWDRLF